MGEFPARVWIKDSDGRYVFVNSLLTSETGIDREKWIGSKDEDLFPEIGHIYWRKDLQVLASGEQLVSTDEIGQGKYLFVVRFPLKIGEEQHVASIGVETTNQMTALIEVVQMRDELFRNERLRSIGEMASGLAHDLRNSLSAATMRLRLVRAKAPENLRPDIDALARSITAATERVQGIQDFVTERPREQLQPIDLVKLLHDAIEMVDFLIQKTPTALGGMIKLESRIPPALPSVRAFPNQLKHVISNLLINARDAMPEGGTLVLEVIDTPSSVEIAVMDDGVGIDPEVMAKIFDPFFTTKQFGNGLGLSMARDVMTRVGGSIEAENRSPRGATFKLKFPIEADTSDETA
jgi:signal transduction histidine kinase